MHKILSREKKRITEPCHVVRKRKEKEEKKKSELK